MNVGRTSSWLSVAMVVATILGSSAAQNAPDTSTPLDPMLAPPPAPLDPMLAPPPAKSSITFDAFLDLAIQRERRLADLLRYFKPVVETYIQEERPDAKLQTAPKADDYFLSRLDLTGNAPADQEFEKPGRSRDKDNGEKKSPRNAEAFAAGGFAQAVFPDLNHFDRANYSFEFVRVETLGDVRCAVINVKPRENTSNRGFVGRIWVENQDYNLVRFTGTYVAKKYAKRAFHFDSWRLSSPRIVWLPAFVYTEESDPHDPSSKGLWFKAQTRIWGYDVQHAGDHREFAKPLTDNPVWFDPGRHEASQDVSPANTVGKSTYTADDDVVERLQVAGLMAPDGDVDRILETVVNNLLITNSLDTAGIRCRVLLTTPLESFVVGRTIVVSRGLLDVLTDEASLAAVLSHELAHIVLGHSIGAQYLSDFSVPFSDLEIFAKFNFRFDAAQEAEADKKGLEIFSQSPYKDQIANVALFLQALEARSAELPNLLHGRFSNDFASSHLVGMQSLAHAPKLLLMDRTDQIAALPIGSRIKVDPWSDRIEMLKAKPATPVTAAEKRPFEVTPFFPHLKPWDEGDKGLKP